jgi:hypothetical protein
MKNFARSDRRPASLTDVLTNAKLSVFMTAMTAIAALQLTASQAMAQPNCDLVKIAEDYVRTRSAVDMTTDRRVRTWLEGTVWKVRFDLPEDTLGFVPEIGIDQRTCQVVSAKLWQ